LPHIEESQSPAVTAAAYQEVRQSFLVRLGSERARLLTLGDALAAGEGVPAAALEDLGRFAHRLRGAAAVFQVPELHDAAKVLELAATAALEQMMPNYNLYLISSMRVLSATLAQAGRGTAETLSPNARA
jgi:HPt (histidine-containing phosphotransfer) domain-containing protein